MNDRHAELLEEIEEGRVEMRTRQKFRMGRPSNFLGDLCCLRIHVTFVVYLSLFGRSF